jgi:hypothetical protein
MNLLDKCDTMCKQLRHEQSPYTPPELLTGIVSTQLKAVIIVFEKELEALKRPFDTIRGVINPLEPHYTQIVMKSTNPDRKSVV